MLVAVLGTPSALTYAGCTIVKTIVESAGGVHALISAVYIAELRKAWEALPREDRERVVIVSDLPSLQLLNLLRASRAPLVVFLDDFEKVVAYLIETRGYATRQALRLTTQALCGLDQLSEEQALRVTTKDCERPLRTIVESLCDLLGLTEVSAVTDDVMARLGYAPSDSIALRDHVYQKPLQFEAPDPAVKASERADHGPLKFVANQYANVGSGIGVTRITWPTDLFFQVDPPRDFLIGPTDLVGPARFISHGPYLHLPMGSWVVTVTFEVSENFSGNHLLVDVASGGVLAACEAPLPASGVFGLDMAFEIVDPFIPVEVRFQIISGAIEGRLELLGAVFRRPESSSESQAGA
jgi:hypothetical protein